MAESSEIKPPPLQELTVDEGFATSFELDTLIESWHAANLLKLFSRFHNHAAELDEGNERNLCRLLAAATSFHLRSDNPTEPYGPGLVIDGRSLSIPVDFSDQQLALFLELAERTRRLDLRARLADMVWVEKRKALRQLNRRSGELALNSFLALASQELDAGDVSKFWTAYERATRLAMQLKAGCLEQLASLCKRAVPVMSEQHAPGLLYRLLKLAWDCKLMSGADISAAALISAERCEAANNWFVAVNMALLAATTHGNSDPAQADTLKLRAAAILERAAEQAATASAIEAAYLMERAIAVYRLVSGTENQRGHCLRRLREFQTAITGEMSSYSFSIDLKELVEAAEKAVSGKGFWDAIWALATCIHPPSVEELQQTVMKNAREFPLQHMMGGVVVDREGKSISRFPGVDGDGDTAQSGMRQKLVELAKVWHHIRAQGYLKPAIRVISAEHSVRADCFQTLVALSPFVPKGRGPIFCVAFQRMFEGNLMEAVHLLLPQVENSVRVTLMQHGVVTSKVKNDMTQEDLNLNEMLFGSIGKEAEKVFGADLLFDMQSVLVDRYGPNLRNTVAHGKAEIKDMYSSDSLYFCWLVLRLCCQPLARHWSTLVHLDETGELPETQANDLPE